MENKDNLAELHTLRHSCSHIMAQAVQNLYPNAKIAIEPAVNYGFYYEIDIEGAILKDEDFAAFEKEMKRLVEMGLRLER